MVDSRTPSTSLQAVWLPIRHDPAQRTPQLPSSCVASAGRAAVNVLVMLVYGFPETTQ